MFGFLVLPVVQIGETVSTCLVCMLRKILGVQHNVPLVLCNVRGVLCNVLGVLRNVTCVLRNVPVYCAMF